MIFGVAQDGGQVAHRWGRGAGWVTQRGGLAPDDEQVVGVELVPNPEQWFSWTKTTTWLTVPVIGPDFAARPWASEREEQCPRGVLCWGVVGGGG